MSTTTIRPMRPSDVDEATAVILAADWGDRRVFLTFVTGHDACRPVVAVRDGRIVGTGVGTVNGRVGWVGTVFVVPEARRLGIGLALTEAVHDALDAAGCRTQVLVATRTGRPLYERLGYDEQCWYRTVEAPGLAAAATPDVRPFEQRDLGAMAALDAVATGEDRAHLLAAFATPDSAKVVERADGTPAAFVVRAPWGGGATVSPDPADAFRILDARRRAAGPDRIVRAGVLDLNADGLARLERDGWTEAWRAVRMTRGEPLAWQPAHLWGQFNHALG